MSKPNVVFVHLVLGSSLNCTWHSVDCAADYETYEENDGQGGTRERVERSSWTNHTSSGSEMLKESRSEKLGSVKSITQRRPTHGFQMLLPFMKPTLLADVLSTVSLLGGGKAPAVDHVLSEQGLLIKIPDAGLENSRHVVVFKLQFTGESAPPS
jgi:hypothetical protein